MTTSQRQNHRKRKQTSGCQGLSMREMGEEVPMKGHQRGMLG